MDRIWLFLLLAGSSGFGALPQEAYVWQRAWTDAVRQAVIEHGTNFHRLVFLKAQVNWNGTRPELVTVPVDYRLLSRFPSVGLALRISAYSGPFGTNHPNSQFLASTAKSLVAEAAASRSTISELQVDFDCAASRLDGYRTWLSAMRESVKPARLVITALPSWLQEQSFKQLIKATDGYVLQVHSLERPRSFNADFTICDPTSALRQVQRASTLGVPFRVALSTYGYTIAFDAAGKYVGLSAEDPQQRWPANALLREVRADPLQMAGLAGELDRRSFPCLEGIIWYRLPVQTDVLNWRWPTLRAIVASRIPRNSVRAESRRVEPGLVEISLVNDGELDISSRFAIHTRWKKARMLAADGLGGFEVTGRAAASVIFENSSRAYRLPAGERQVIGWVRLSEDCEVQVEVQNPGGKL